MDKQYWMRRCEWTRATTFYYVLEEMCVRVYTHVYFTFFVFRYMRWMVVVEVIRKTNSIYQQHESDMNEILRKHLLISAALGFCGGKVPAKLVQGCCCHGVLMGWGLSKQGGAGCLGYPAKAHGGYMY